MPSTTRARDRGTPMTLLVAGCLWGAHSLVGCAPESITVGALDANGGEGNTGGEGDGGPTSGGTRSVTGGRGGGGTGTGVGGGGRNQAGLGSAAEGGDPGRAGFPGAGFSGSGAGAGQGGFAGSFAGNAGSAGDGSIPVAGSFGESGNGGAGGNGGSGGVFGDAGYGNSGGVFGYAGDAAVGAELFQLPPADAAGCTRGICEGTFEWRAASIAEDDYSFTDLSGDGRVLIGYGAQGRAFRMSWDAAQMWMLLGADREFPAEATSFGGTLLVGGNRWTRDNGPPTIIAGIPDAYGAVAVSSDGQVVAAVDAAGSYVYRSGQVDAVPDYLFWAVSADGTAIAGERLADGRAVIAVVQGDEGGIGDIAVLPVHDGWVPRAVNGLSSSGSLAVGYASNADLGTGAQAFRWQRGSAELELLGSPEGTDASWARDCNADCSIVVGVTSAGDTTADGFVYDDAGGMLSVSDYGFQRAGVAAISGLSVETIRISLDGTRIAGGGLKDATRIVFHQRFTSSLAAR